MPIFSVVQLKFLSIFFIITTIIFLGLFSKVYMEFKNVFKQNEKLVQEIAKLNLKINELESLKNISQVKIIPRKGMTAEELRKQAYK